ncbi:chitinase-like protein 3 [Pleurodeles waltl]|uniref:chitinase-like protein 3 n=1 Tax=Pleurodeles waltl TaxID=8319 RepID=UPI003709AF16
MALCLIHQLEQPAYVQRRTTKWNKATLICVQESQKNWEQAAGVALLLHAQTASGAYKLLCYYSDRAWRRSGPARLMPTDTDPCLCTHLVYAFATIEENKITTADLSDGDLYVLFNNIKKRNLRLLTLLAVGGDEFDMTRFTTMVSSSSNRAIFIDSVIQLLRSFNFDGIDLHFQYPGSGVSPPEDKNRFTLLVQEMMAAFQFESAKKGIPRLMITAAVSAKKATIEAGYEISELSQSLDLISVMTYNFHGGWENMTAHHSPLYEWPTGQGDSVYFNCEYAMKHWKNSTMRSKKLLMGFPTYGRTFTLSTITNCTVLSPASGHGSAGSYTEEAGILAFYEICRIPEGNSTSFQFNRDAQVPYACYGNQWIGYDDQLSFELKEEFRARQIILLLSSSSVKIYQIVKGNIIPLVFLPSDWVTLKEMLDSFHVEFLLENGFGGAAVWSLDMDDFNGRFCNKGVYPLTSKLKDLLGLDTGDFNFNLDEFNNKDSVQLIEN